MISVDKLESKLLELKAKAERKRIAHNDYADKIAVIKPQPRKHTCLECDKSVRCDLAVCERS